MTLSKPVDTHIDATQRRENTARMERLCATSVRIIREKPRQIGLIAADYGRLAMSRAMSQSQASTDAFRDALSSTQLLFARAPGSHLEKAGVLEGEPVQIGTAEIVSSSISPNSWRRWLFLAILLRDEAEGIAAAEYPLNILLESSTTAPPAAYTLCEALAGFRLDAGGWQDSLREAIAEAEVQDDAKEYARDISLPFMRLLSVIYAGTEPFNAALHDALIAHRAYYSRGNRKNDPKGFLALGPAALAAWAFDCDTEITVESDYIPRWLIEGRFDRHKRGVRDDRGEG